MSQLLNRLGRASARHKWRVLLVWLVALSILVVLSQAYGGQPVDNFRLPNSDAQVASDVLHRSFPTQTGSTAELVFHTDRPLFEGSTRQQLRDAVGRVRGLPHVIAVSEPLAPGTVSADGTIARTEVRYDRSTEDMTTEDYNTLRSALAPLESKGVQAEIGGPLASWESRGGFSGEQIGLLVALVVLTFVFGSVLAMLLPIGLALVTVLAGAVVLTLLEGFADFPSATPEIAAMIGLGVALDYALFIVSRYVDRIRQGEDPEHAAGHAAATAGLAVFFAGSTVVIAITGLMLSGVMAIGMIGVGVAAIVITAVLGALTLLPAMLGLLGTHAVRSRLPFLRTAAAHENRRSGQWARTVVSHPVRGLLGALVVLLVLASPVLALRLGQVDAGTAAPSTSQRKSFDLLAQGFGPGFNDPLVIVVDGPDAARPSVLDAISKNVASDPDVAAVGNPQLNGEKTVAVIQAFARTSPHDQKSSELVQRLRSGALSNMPGVRVLLTGSTAGNVDVAAKMSERLPVLILGVVAVSFVLLAIGFRSLLVPFKAAVMNVLSIGAGYGVVVAVFQWGWGKGLVGLEETVPIVSWVPLLMFAILFGLSMDYEVFLISAIRSAHERTGDNRQAVIEGLTSTARIITAAAAIMLVVFGSFVAYPDPTVKMVGLGLAVSILVDATIVRMVLVPSTMVLLGEANWWLPKWLGRLLPSVDLEGEVDGQLTPSPVRPVVPGVVGSGR